MYRILDDCRHICIYPDPHKLMHDGVLEKRIKEYSIIPQSIKGKQAVTEDSEDLGNDIRNEEDAQIDTSNEEDAESNADYDDNVKSTTEEDSSSGNDDDNTSTSESEDNVEGSNQIEDEVDAVTSEFARMGRSYRVR